MKSLISVIQRQCQCQVIIVFLILNCWLGYATDVWCPANWNAEKALGRAVCAIILPNEGSNETSIETVYDIIEANSMRSKSLINATNSGLSLQKFQENRQTSIKKITELESRLRNLQNMRKLIEMMATMEAIKGTEIVKSQQLTEIFNFIEKIGIRAELSKQGKGSHVTLYIADKTPQIISKHMPQFALQKMIEEIKDFLPWDTIEQELQQCYLQLQQTKQKLSEFQTSAEKVKREQIYNEMVDTVMPVFENQILKRIENKGNQSFQIILQSFDLAYLAYKAQSQAIVEFHQFFTNVGNPDQLSFFLFCLFSVHFFRDVFQNKSVF